ncbi:hypothetical protein ATANTOWER_004918 [Ataeniobius toweri]|uniref:Uncharacterized protein n=1 Tax=Ataeniobius toweri TaxID=208326 RepID=A0ABU7BK60_9TELE|nr:hypothetical protein [Ataeniobius toweri]
MFWSPEEASYISADRRRKKVRKEKELTFGLKSALRSHASLRAKLSSHIIHYVTTAPYFKGQAKQKNAQLQSCSTHAECGIFFDICMSILLLCDGSVAVDLVVSCCSC